MGRIAPLINPSPSHRPAHSAEAILESARRALVAAQAAGRKRTVDARA